MPRRKYTPEQIISKLREAEVLLSKGQTVGQACKSLGVQGSCSASIHTALQKASDRRRGGAHRTHH